MEQKWRVLDKLVRSYSGPHGKMDVLHNGDYSHIVPTALKKKDGQVVAFEPMLSTRVSFQPSQRSLLDTVRLIMSQVSSTRSISIGLGTIPTNLFVQRSQLTYADNEQARDVLMRIFEDAKGAIQLKGGIEQRVTWSLLYDASGAGYFFNAHIADPLIRQSVTPSPGNNSVTPGSQIAPPHP
jgi:hypothetical protein